FQIANYKLPITNSFLFFHNRIVAIADEAGAHRLGVLEVGVGSDLNAIVLVDGSIVSAEGGILFLLQSLDQRVGVFLPGNRGDLHVITAGRGRSACGIGSDRWRRRRS